LLAVAAAALTALLSGLVSTLPVVLLAVLSALLALFAAVLIARAEPVALARGHRHWRRATRHRDAAVATAQSDAESAAVTRESWLGLVRAATAAEDEQVAREAIAVAASMIEPDQMGYRISSGSLAPPGRLDWSVPSASCSTVYLGCCLARWPCRTRTASRVTGRAGNPAQA